MKLFIGAVALTMALTACSGSGGGSSGNTKEIDGNYVSFSKDDEGKLHLEYTEIRSGSVTAYDIALENGNYSILKASANVNNGKAKVKIHSHSCFDVNQPGVVEEDDENSTIVLNGDVLTIKDSEQTDLMLKVSDQDGNQIKQGLATFELLKGAGCEEKMSFEGTDVSMEENRELLKRLLESESDSEVESEE